MGHVRFEPLCYRNDQATLDEILYSLRRTGSSKLPARDLLDSIVGSRYRFRPVGLSLAPGGSQVITLFLSMTLSEP